MKTSSSTRSWPFIWTSLCFKDWTTNYHLEVVDKAAKQVNVQIQEVLNFELINAQVATMTAICNFPNKKFIVKITPTMISCELLDGEVFPC